MRGEFPFLVAQAPQVHDAAHARSARRTREVLRTQTIPRLEALRTRTAHRVDHVVGGVHPFERWGQGFRAQHVALDDLRLRTDATREELRPARQAAHRESPLLQSREEPAPHVTRNTRQENALLHHRHFPRLDWWLSTQAPTRCHSSWSHATRASRPVGISSRGMRRNWTRIT